MIEFLVYSDIHHDDYKNGLLLTDTIMVEEEITDYADSFNIKEVIFLGDWYRATNPLQIVIKAAEAAWKRRSDLGIYTRVLVGNHDRATKSINSNHAFAAADIFSNDLEHVCVFDKITQIIIDGINFLFIPSGHENVEIPGENRDFDVVLFHGLLSGSALANGGSVSGGIHPDILKSINAKLYLGGDNHTYQRLNSLLGVESMYLGAPLQHNWGDRNQVRGFWHIKLGSTIECIHVPTQTPRFIRENIQANTEIEAVMNAFSVLNEKLDGRPGIIDLTLVGRNVASLNKKSIEEQLSSLLNFNCRQLKINIDQTFEKIEISPGLAKLNNPEDKWSNYISSGKVPNMKDMSVQLLSEVGRWAIQEAKKL